MPDQSDKFSDHQTSSLILDRRQSIRIKIRLSASTTGPDQVQREATIVDISAAGAKLQMPDADLTNSSSLTIRFRLGMEYEFTASPIWHLEMPDHVLMGVQWTSPTTPEHERLAREIMRIAVMRRRLKG